MPFLKAQVAALRLKLVGRSDLLSVRAYPALWQMERVSYRSDQMSGVKAKWLADVARLQDASMPRGVSWMNALWNASFLMEVPVEKLAPGYVKDFASHYPHASPSQMVVIESLRKLGPTEEAFEKRRELSGAYPASTGIVSHWMSVARGAEDDGTALVDAYQAMKSAMDLNPESYLTSPPFQITMAEDLVNRGIRFDLVPSFVIAGIAAGERAAGHPFASTAHPRKDASRVFRDSRREGALCFVRSRILAFEGHSGGKAGKEVRRIDCIPERAGKLRAKDGAGRCA